MAEIALWLLVFFFGGGRAVGTTERPQNPWCDSPSVVGIYSGGRSCLRDEPRKEISSGSETEAGTLEGITLNVGIFEGSDYEHDCNGTVDDGKIKSERSYSDFILGLLQDVLRFKSSRSWRYLERSTNSWTGLASLVANNLTDLNVCHWTPTDHLTRIADFLFPTLETTESFVYLPQNLPLTQDVFVATFSSKLWIFFLLSIFLIIISFRFSTFMHSSIRPDHEPWSWDEVVLWAVAAVSQQSYSRHPRGSSCRTMFLIGYTITYLLYTGFAAGITSLLALQAHQNQLSFDDVAVMRLNLLFNREEYHFDFLKKSMNPNTMQGEQGNSLSEIFSKIKNANFVGLGSTLTLVNYLARKVDPSCRKDFVVVPIPYSTHGKVFLTRKNFPFKNAFNYWLLRLKESGLLELGRQRFLSVKEPADHKSTRWLSASLGNIFSAFAFLVGGWLLSILIFCAEILRKGKKK